MRGAECPPRHNNTGHSQMIKLGDQIPSLTLKKATAEGPKAVTTDEIFKGKRAFSLDPAAPDRKTTSKAIIDATRQWPDEGGPPFYQELNRAVLERAAPGVVERVKAKWPRKLLRQRRF